MENKFNDQNYLVDKAHIKKVKSNIEQRIIEELCKLDSKIGIGSVVCAMVKGARKYVFSTLSEVASSSKEDRELYNFDVIRDEVDNYLLEVDLIVECLASISSMIEDINFINNQIKKRQM